MLCGIITEINCNMSGKYVSKFKIYDYHYFIYQSQKFDSDFYCLKTK